MCLLYPGVDYQPTLVDNTVCGTKDEFATVSKEHLLGVKQSADG
jgi:hypothetical protein